jgi:parallel beta-helix repeat protein
VAALGAAVLPATSAQAATTLYVAKGNGACSNSGPGTSSRPFCSIGAANAKAVAGTTVQVLTGTYAESVTVANSGTASAPVVFTASSGVTVTGGANGFRISSKAYVTIKGFTVTKTSDAGILASGSNHITLDSNNVSVAGKRASGSTANGILLSGTKTSVVRNNKTHDNSDAGIAVTGGSTGNTISGNESYSNARGYTRAAAGIDLRNSGSNTITGNRLHDNEDSGLNIWTSSNNSTARSNNVYSNGDHGIDVHSTNGAQVTGNTVCRNTDSGIEMTGSLNTVLNGNVSGLNGINSPRTSGQIRTDSTSAPSTRADNDKLYQQSPLSSNTVFIDWAGTKYTSLASFQKATGQELHGSQVNGC